MQSTGVIGFQLVYISEYRSFYYFILDLSDKGLQLMNMLAIMNLAILFDKTLQVTNIVKVFVLMLEQE